MPSQVLNRISCGFQNIVVPRNSAAPRSNPASLSWSRSVSVHSPNQGEPGRSGPPTSSSLIRPRPRSTPDVPARERAAAALAATKPSWAVIRHDALPSVPRPIRVDGVYNHNLPIIRDPDAGEAGGSRMNDSFDEACLCNGIFRRRTTCAGRWPVQRKGIHFKPAAFGDFPEIV
jgi:hypothetical protein